jgi:hypothetical protein
VANQHITAALRCSQFKGTTRLVLFVLADAASPGKNADGKGLPLGYCKRKLQTIMTFVNCRRQPTVTAAIRKLKMAGAIKQWLKQGASPLYFVDLDWLQKNAYTEAEQEAFEYSSLKMSRKADPEDAASSQPTNPTLDFPYA